MRHAPVLSGLLLALSQPCTTFAQAPTMQPPADAATSGVRQLALAAPGLQVIPGPVPSDLLAALPSAIEGPERGLRVELNERSGPNWKTGVIVGASLGVLFGITVASWDGDEGSDRSTGDRVSSGLIAGGIVAVPATVIFALLFGED